MIIPPHIMDQIDRTANRVTIAAFSGIFVGAAIATYRGSPMLRTSLSVAASCAMTGTACFVTERAAFGVISTVDKNEKNLDRTTKLLVSHAVGGFFGGGLSGFLFQKRPLQGMMMFTPIMMTVAFVELELQRYKKDRVREILADSSSRNSLSLITKSKEKQMKKTKDDDDDEEEA